MFDLFTKHRCPTCGKKYRKVENLMHHRLVAHETSNSYECSNCGETFGDMDLLKAHIRRDHSFKKKSDSN